MLYILLFFKTYDCGRKCRCGVKRRACSSALSALLPGHVALVVRAVWAAVGPPRHGSGGGGGGPMKEFSLPYCSLFALSYFSWLMLKAVLLVILLVVRQCGWAPGVVCSGVAGGGRREWLRGVCPRVVVVAGMRAPPVCRGDWWGGWLFRGLLWCEASRPSELTSNLLQNDPVAKKGFFCLNF